MSTGSLTGFIGLGNIGAPMATNLCAGGFPLIAYDAAGTTARLPVGAQAALSATDVASRVRVLFLSLPNGAVVESVVEEIISCNPESLHIVVDLSTVGVQAARRVGAKLSAVGINYLDAPVSGGAAGARNRKISIMCAGPRATLEGARAQLRALSDKIYHVGERPGQGQALKLLNNFLSATALAATSEAVVFGLRHGLQFDSMLEVLNASSGASAATADKFPNHIANGKFASGFQNTLMAKDLGLFLSEAQAERVDGQIGTLVTQLWMSFGHQMPASDFTRIFEYVEREISDRPQQ